jgi:hypothetical protein
VEREDPHEQRESAARGGGQQRHRQTSAHLKKLLARPKRQLPSG